MKYLLLLLVLSGCAKESVTQRNVEEEIYRDPLELIFTKEELEQFKNLKEGESIPPDMSKIALLDTNLIDFPKEFWKDPVWFSNYTEAAKDMPTNLSPKEATIALSNYLASNHEEIIHTKPFHETAFYVLYHYAEQGADLSYNPPNPEEGIYWPASSILDLYFPALLNTVTQVAEKLYIGGEVLTVKELKNALTELNYIIDKETNVLEYVRYLGWQKPLYTEAYKLLVQKGLDLNSFIDPSYWIILENGEELGDNIHSTPCSLYYDTLRVKNPYTAYMLIALGYSNEVGEFQLTNYY